MNHRRSCSGIFSVLFALAANKILYTEAILCYKCDSIELESCAMSLNETELPYVECASTLQCTMSIVDSITYRGCYTNTPTVGATYKKTCAENLCNKGVFPPGRLKCHHCNPTDEQCVLQQTVKPKPCRYHLETDQCYTEASEGTNVYRGCRSDSNHTIANENLAEFCDINGCNTAAAVTHLKCAVCDSHSARGCKMDLFEVSAQQCNISMYEECEVDNVMGRINSAQCYTYHHLDHVTRGCSSDLPAEISANDLQKYEFCSDGDLCNAKCLTQQKCLVCDSTTNSACLMNSEEKSAKICPSAEASSCYACEYTNWEVQRGCGSPAQTSDTTRCYECDDKDGCNATPFTRCYKCNSVKNVNCASWDRPGTGTIDIEDCQTPGAACVMAAFADGVTWRGCESERLHCNDTLTQCQTCDGSFCNKGAYPANRLSCYQCADGWNECTDPTPCVPSLWEPGDLNDACFEYLNEGGSLVRGCRSDTPSYLQCLLNSASCRICNTDGCNYRLDKGYAIKSLINV